MSRAIHANRTQVFLLPPSLDEWVPESHPARFVADLVEVLDLKALGFRDSPGDEGRPHFASELLLGVWLYGWMERVRSSRALEKACQRDLGFVWLTSNLHPDHNTLWRFFRDNKAAITKLFKRVVVVAAKAGLIGFALHAVDGTKMRVASSMDSALHRKALLEQLQKLDQIVASGVAQIEADERQASPEWSMPATLTDAEERKRRIREQLAQLDAADIDHLHPKEPDARVMYTREGQRLSYNAQAMVDHDSDMIVAVDISGDETDHQQLVPMMQAVFDTFGQVAEQTVADAGYASGAQFEEAERRHLPVIVAVQKESSKGPYAKSHFAFDAERDAYVCPLGEVLPFEGLQKRGKDESHTQRRYRCHNDQCPVRAECTTDKKGRAIKRLVTEEAFERQVARQSSPDKRVLLSLRKEIVEHIFGIAKAVDGFRRFTVRQIEGARAQWALLALAINMRKLLPAWREGRLHLAARA